VRALLGEQATLGFDYPVNNAWSATLAGWGMHANHVHDAVAARTLYDLLAPWSGQVACNRVYAHGTVDGALGRLASVLGDYDHAEVHFDAAEEQNTALGSQFFAAYDAIDRATMYLARNGDGDRERAEQYATQALEGAREHGYANIEQRAAALLEGLPAA
jgi:tetratricopeptide (TPR) repeat protein